MTIYDKSDPTDPKLITLATTKERGERFRRVSAIDGAVRCIVDLNTSYEAQFSMTPDHARAVAVQLIDAAEGAEAQEEKRQDGLRQRAAELTSKRKRGRS
jgi:hypothetical protein